MEIKYPLAKETIDSFDIQALIEWLSTNPRLTMGGVTKEFEQAWADYIGTKYAVFVNSGSSANLLMTYVAAIINKTENKKIVVPSVGWGTTIFPAMQFGLEPIMVDADPETFGIDLKQLEEICIKEKPYAVIFVQVLGVPHKLEILKLQEKYGFILLEDGCAALGSEYEGGRKVGTIGDMSTFSFYFGHQLSTIEGGMINTNDPNLYNLLLVARSHGWIKDLDKSTQEKIREAHNIDGFHEPFTFILPGFNVRSTDLQAFIGLRQVAKANNISSARNANHILYAEKLKSNFSFQNWGKNIPVSISFGALAQDTEHRTRVVNRLVAYGIETRIFSAGNLGKHPFWKDRYGEFNGEVANKIHSQGFFLPNYPELTPEDIKWICGIVNGA